MSDDAAGAAGLAASVDIAPDFVVSVSVLATALCFFFLRDLPLPLI